MTKSDRKDILFPDEIIPWDDAVKLAVNLLIPFRHRAIGIECITGGWGSFRTIPGGPIQWLPFRINEDVWRFIKDHLQELPTLEFPIPLGIANEFIDKFIMLKESPDFVPSFLTHSSLIHDQKKRDDQFNQNKEELNRLISKGDVLLVSESRIKCVNLSNGVFFTKKEAIQYLDRKGLLDKALATGCSWRDLAREPELGDLSAPVEENYYGLQRELLRMGIQEYRRTLTLRKHASVASQLAQFPSSLGMNGGVVDEKSCEGNAKEPVIELVKSSPILMEDALTPIQVLGSPVIGNNKVKSGFTKFAVAPENDEASSKESPIAESEIASATEKNPVVKKLIGMSEVMELLGVSRTTIYNYIKPDSPSYKPNFPKPTTELNGNKWDESEINAYVESLLKNSQPLKKKANTNR